jgi:uncharacterized protein YktA (UPF0223 family)
MSNVFENDMAKYRIETEIEKKFHKIVSSIRYGEKIIIPTIVKTKEEEKAIWKALEKTARYNCIELHMRWDKNKENIKISVESV